MKYLSKGMISDPSYYSGRGATISDLTSKDLDQTYENIVKEFGENAGESFILLIQNLEVLSATDFIISLKNLENNNWEYSENILSKMKGQYAGNEAQALFGALSRPTGDDTARIANPFLNRFNKSHYKKQDMFLGKYVVMDEYGNIRNY